MEEVKREKWSKAQWKNWDPWLEGKTAVPFARTQIQTAGTHGIRRESVKLPRRLSNRGESAEPQALLAGAEPGAGAPTSREGGGHPRLLHASGRVVFP